MAESEFPANSEKSKAEKKKGFDMSGKTDPEFPPAKREKVVAGAATLRKKSFGSKVKETFLGGEFKSASSYIFREVLLPALQNLVVDATSKGIERVIYGDSTPRMPRRGIGTGGPRVTYNASIPTSSRAVNNPVYLPGQPPRYRGGAGRRQAFEDVILESKSEAVIVLSTMNELIDQYDFVTISELHDLVGLQSTYVDQQWGWSDLRFADIKQIREGYLLDLPPVEQA